MQSQSVNHCTVSGDFLLVKEWIGITMIDLLKDILTKFMDANQPTEPNGDNAECNAM